MHLASWITVLALVECGRGLLLTPTNTSVGHNGVSTEFHLLLNIFHNETKKVEQYVAALEQKVLLVDNVLQQKLNKTGEELTKLNAELQAEKSRRAQLQVANDDITFRFFNLSLGYNSIISRMQALQKENVILKSNIHNFSTVLNGIDVNSLQLDRTQIQQIKQKQDFKMGFTASNPRSGRSSDTISFQTAVSNAGNAFNQSTGAFTCHVPGVYFFSLTVVKEDVADHAYCYIRKNGQHAVQAGVDPPVNADGGWYGATNSVVFHLQGGDVVDLGGCSEASTFFNDTSFTGFIVNVD